MPVGGSRHYNGGLGPIGAWHCPSCGAENSGPLEQGCVLCGAGKPGTRAGTPPPAQAAQDVRRGDVADYWASQHPVSTITEAYRAGYEDGLLAAARAAQQDVRRPRPAAMRVFSPAGKTVRTMIAALTIFREQVLTEDTEEVTTGEWCSADDVLHLIDHLATQLQQLEKDEQQKEHTHA